MNIQFIKNLGLNGTNFLVNMILGLVLPPFIINRLGVSAFGILQIAISIAAYSAVLSSSLNQANNRFVSISLIRKDHKETSAVLTNIFGLYTIAFLLIIPALLYISFNYDGFLKVDSSLSDSAISYMILLVLLSQVFVMTNTALLSPLYAKNRLDIIQGVNIVRNALKLILVFVFVLYVDLTLTSVGQAFFLSALISSTIAFVIFKRVTPFYQLHFSDFNKRRLKDLYTLSTWTGIGAVGSMLFLQTDIILINMFLGSEMSGEYAILVQWSMLMIGISTILSVVVAPNIMIEYANSDFSKLKRILYNSVKYQGVFTAFISTIVFVYAEIILELWVGKEYVKLADYLRIMVIHMGFSQAFRQIFTVNTAYNKVRYQGLSTLVTGGFHILTSLILLSFTDMGILGVIISNVFFYVLLQVVILPLYVSKYLKDSYSIFIRNLLATVKMIIVVTVIGTLTKMIIQPNQWISLIVSVSVTAIVSLIIGYFSLLLKNERQYIIDFIGKTIGNEN